MFADPQTIHPVDADISLPRVSVGSYAGTFTDSNGIWKLSISHQNRKNGAESSLVRIDRTVSVSDSISGLASRQTHTAYLVVQRPMNAYGKSNDPSPSETLNALVTWLGVSANKSKFLGLEA